MCKVMQDLVDKCSKEQAINTATTLLKLEVSIEKISLATGLSPEEVKELAEKIKNES